MSTNDICEKNWSSTPFAPFTGRPCLADGRPLLARTQAQGLRRPLLLPGVVVVRVPSCEFASSDDYSHFAAARPNGESVRYRFFRFLRGKSRGFTNVVHTNSTNAPDLPLVNACALAYNRG
ncbi:hypothetical protein CE91St32_19360 [Gordonibacter pamelaeae]|nr:hypothetical protein CE91St32_19360 [Gordonibacter pamelaeae]